MSFGAIFTFTIVVAIVFLIIWISVASMWRGAQLNRIEAALAQLRDFTVTQGLLICGGFAIDEERQKIALINCAMQSEVNLRVLAWTDVMDCEVFVDEDSTEVTQRGSQMAGAAVGGLLFGGLGAVVGGLSGRKRHVRNVHNVGLRIYLNDIENPVREIYFKEGGGGSAATNESEARSAIRTANYWYGVLSVLRQSAGQKMAPTVLQDHDAQAVALSESETITIASHLVQNEGGNLAQQLGTLADLKERGLLSDAEFSELKSRIIESEGREPQRDHST